jgi:hypothetical protein
VYHVHALRKDGVLLLHLFVRADDEFACTTCLELLLLVIEIPLYFPALLFNQHGIGCSVNHLHFLLLLFLLIRMRMSLLPPSHLISDVLLNQGEDPVNVLERLQICLLLTTLLCELVYHPKEVLVAHVDILATRFVLAKFVNCI